jgi:hypothetical protein
MSEHSKLVNSPEWQEMQENADKAQKAFEAECDRAWNSLDQETKLKLFCAVCTRLYKGELEDKGSYRHVLYEVFGFGPEAYGTAQAAGFLALHNAIIDEDQELATAKKLAELAKEYNIPKEQLEGLLGWNLVNLYL